MCNTSSNEIYAGDDVTYIVKCRDPNNPEWPGFIDGADISEMVITGLDEPIRIQGSIGDPPTELLFYISGEQTQALADAIQPKFCIHIYWHDGGRSTPVAEAPLIFRRCCDD